MAEPRVAELVTRQSMRLAVEALLIERGWTPVERIIGRKVNVFWERRDHEGTLGIVAAVQAQIRREERPR